MRGGIFEAGTAVYGCFVSLILLHSAVVLVPKTETSMEAHLLRVILVRRMVGLFVIRVTVRLWIGVHCCLMPKNV